MINKEKKEFLDTEIEMLHQKLFNPKASKNYAAASTQKANLLYYFTNLNKMLERLRTNDHLSLIYETPDEWRTTIIPYIKIGLQRGEKCLYFMNDHTAHQIRNYLCEEGVNVTFVEATGQFTILHATEVYTRKGYFDPNQMIELLIQETKRAIDEGYSGLRVAAEMSWIHYNYPGSERLLEYEAKLNQDFFPNYPCVAICQYSLWKFDPEIIKGILLTHPLLIWGTRIYRNFYYIRPEQYLSKKRTEKEIRHWLGNLEGHYDKQERLSMLADILEHSPQPFFAVYPDRHLIICNQAYCELTGYKEKELRAMTSTQEFTPPEWREHEIRALERLRRTGQPQSYEKEYIRKDGSRVAVEISAHQLCDPQGNVKYYYSFINNITGRKQMENSLKQYQLFYEHARDIVLFTRLDGQLIEANNTAFSTYGYDREELLSMKIHDLQAYDTESLIEIQLKQAYSKGLLFETFHRRKDGSTFPVEVSSQGTIINNEGTIISVIRNITERKHAEEVILHLNQELEHRAIELEASNKELESFSYSVSHDLRTPLRSIDGFSQLLLEDYTDKLSTESKDYLQRIRAASQHMAQLIDDLLNLSQVTRHEIEYQEVNLSTIVQNIATELQKMQPHRKVEFVIVPKLFSRGDLRLIRVTLENLIGNAWKFTEKQPHARIEFGTIEHNDKPVYFVRDNGAGFDMAYSNKLFAAFQRLHAETEFPGTGIGLATVKRIIDRHGGQTWAEGEVNKGATFYFTL